MDNEKKFVNNYYQGIYLTETIMGNPNGDFIDNSPRNFDGIVFTTDKCIKYNIRKYIHESIEDISNKKNVVFFFPRLTNDADKGDMKFQTRDDIFTNLYDSNFEDLKINSPDVRMFGGTFSFKKRGSENISKQIYGPIQLSYGIDINDAQIKKLQIGAPFSTSSGSQKTTGTESVVDDAIISYDITINPNNHPDLLLNNDLNLFKKALWFGTNLRKSTSKKTDSKLLILIKFKNDSDDHVKVLNIGELKELVEISNKKDRKMGNEIIKLNCDKLINKLSKYAEFIENIDVYCDDDEVKLEYEENKNLKINFYNPEDLLR